ncbi:MAG: hypothetical protein ACLTC4_14160 [Hungatella hathewayi]|uniref:DUF3037 domain-containing protein n=1 Tax=Hungatella hathewayi WAL-18680 TaxID=742737 RepID=G5IF12_9FIRM|nr:hypothetical protein [Hungatella hathewayi]EHI59941.1 hypothetical protein HMPREF9473_02089 [ [Hungatella hathewayi WAL-18680]MBS4984332.1 hypothetical protein [Hungatella hathewayi]
MDIIEYTALKYYNSCVSEECLYLGMLFNNLTKNTRVFKSIRNFKRLESFDDEINIEFFKDYLCSIKAEIEDNIFNYDKAFNLKEYIKPYVNELRFSSIKTEKTDDPDFIENMVKLFLKFDYDKKQRLSKETEKKYIKKVLKSSHIDFSEEPIIGKYNENIRLDLVTDNYGIKLFKFEGKDLTRLVTNAKAWAYNAREMKDAKKIVFLYDVDFENSEKFDTIIKILKEDAFKVMPYETGIDYITNITSD